MISTPNGALTQQSVAIDLASWWSYAILKRGELHLFDQLDGVLETLQKPLASNSALCTRLRCLVPWQELLKQLYTPGCTVGKKRFDVVQDKLVLLKQDLNNNNNNGGEDDDDRFDEVLRMIQTHSILSELYAALTRAVKTNGSIATIPPLLDRYHAQWKQIYLDCDEIPPSLRDLVHTANGWDLEDRKDHILQIVSFKDSTLTYKRLKQTVQSLLLHWFERILDVDDHGNKRVPELLEKRFRGIGFGNTNNTNTNNNLGVPSADTTTTTFNEVRGTNRQNDAVVARSAPPQHQPQKRKEPAARANPKRMRENDTGELSSTASVTSGGDQPQTKLPNRRHERKRRYQQFLQQQQQQQQQQTYHNRVLSMPVGEPSSGSKDTWTKAQDDALRKGMKWSGYGNWSAILVAEDELLGSKTQEDLRDRANLLLLSR